MKLALAILLVSALVAPGQSPDWRLFNRGKGLSDDPCLTMTIGAAGDILVAHSNSVAVFNGYTAAQVPRPETNPGSFYESPAGELWSAGTQGVWEFRDGKWLLHSAPEINTKPIAIWPVREGQALVLLPDRLLELEVDDANTIHIQNLCNADHTGLKTFTGQAPANDGGLWISGVRGLAKITGPLRELKSGGHWTGLFPPVGLQNFRNVSEDDSGNLTVLAESSESHSMMLVQYLNQRWVVRKPNVDRPRFAWRAGGESWIATDDLLWELPDDKTGAIPIKEIRPGRIFDAAAEPGGTFWLATANGLFRHAPAIWDAAAPPRSFLPGQNGADLASILEGIRENPGRVSLSDTGADGAVIARGNWNTFLNGQNGDLWLGGASEIAWRHGGLWRIFSSTNQLEPAKVIGFAEAPDGEVWCATATDVWEFDGNDWVQTRSGFGHINDLYCARDGALWVATGSGLWRLLRGAWIENGLEDGLPSDSVSEITEDLGGRIWADTPAGWSVFNPGADTEPPNTLLEASAGVHRNVREGTPVIISFSGRDKWDQTSVERLLFSWRLDGGEWSPFDEPTPLTFNDLAAGNHLFQVRAMDRNGNIAPAPARAEIAVVLPWYREPQLVVVLAMALVVATFFASLALNRHRRLLRSYAEVEKKIAERTRELEIASRELLHSQKMNALGTLAAGIAHDFNNILSIIKGSAQIIEDNADQPEKIRTRVDRIKTVVRQGAEIVDAMLGFSRGSDASTVACDVNSVVADTIKLLGDRFLRQVEVKFEREGEIPEIFGTREFIQQILLNLVFNAAEAGSKKILLKTGTTGKLPVDIFLAPAASASFVMISVRDNGSGIAPEIMGRIFEPFFTTKALSSRRGAGLGLSMVYELAKKMNGGLALQSVVGEGSTFTLILPVTDRPVFRPETITQPTQVP